MVDDQSNAHRPTDQVGDVSTDIQLALDQRLADLTQLLKTNPPSSSTEAAHVEAHEDAFPNHPSSDTFAEPLGLDNLIDDIWDLRRQHQRPFDPLLYLGYDVMHEVLQYAVSLWDIAESRARGTEIIPRNYMGDPLVLMSVSRRWSQFITSSPRLWSYVLIDTNDEDVLEYLQIFLQLSRNTKLFILLHGSAALCDTIVVDLLRVGDRIGALVYPPNVSRSTLARFLFHRGASHDQLEHVCRWYKLEVQSITQPQQYLNRYSFPTSIQSLWMGGVFPLSRLVELSHFQSLSFLSARLSLDGALPPAHDCRLEFPKLEELRVQMTLASHHQVDTPINMICRNLKLLDLRYRLELNPENLREQPVVWMEFGGIDALKELQVDLAIHVVTEVGLIEPLAKWPQMRQLQELQLQKLLQPLQRVVDQEPEQLEWEQLRCVEELELELLEWERQWRYSRHQPRLGPYTQQQKEQRQKEKQEREEHLKQREQHLRFMLSICTRWREWLNLPESLTYIQQSSLKVTLSARMHQEASGVIKDMVEEILVWRLPRLTELATSKFLRTFPKHLRKLRFHGFAISDSPPSITLPGLVSLEIIADSPDHLLVMGNIQVPQLRDLRVQVKDGLGTLHQHDWRDTTNNLLDHISLRIEIPRDKQGNHILVFHLPQTFYLPQTQSLNIFSPSRPLHLYLAEPAPLFYTLNANLGTMWGPSSALWNEKLVTEWISPCGIPILARFRTLISLQRIVLSQRPYVLSEQSPADTLFKLLERNSHTCPGLNSITLAQCPSSWPRFLYQLCKRNRKAILRKTKCIEELIFYQPLHATIIRWLTDAISARISNVIERPPIREGNAWPMRPFGVIFEAERVFRSCYVCHITGMEPGCIEYGTRNVDCGKERGEGSKVYAP